MHSSELENYKSLKANQKLLAEREAEKINKQHAIREDFMRNYNNRMDRRARLDAEHTKLMEAARDQALSTAIKAIYISALEAETLTDDALLLAENLVDKWIKERGGASKILEGVSDKTYLLNRLSAIVEEAAEETVKEIEKDELAEDKPETKAEKKEDAEDSAKEFIKDASKKEIKDFMNTLVDKITDKVKKDEKEKMEKKEEEAAEAEDTGAEEKADSETEAPADDTKSDDSTEVEAKDDDKEVEIDADTEVLEEPKKEENADETAPEEGSEEKVEDTEVEVKEEEPAEEEQKDEEPKADDTESEAAPESTEESDDKQDDDAGNEDVDADTEVEVKDDETEAPADDTAAEEAPEDLKVDDTDADGEVSDEEIEKDTEEDLGEPLGGDDKPNADTDLDGDIEDNVEDDAESKMFKELEDEEDVQKAVEIIRTRVADAEENFIRNNAEDKKKMDELLNKISNNVKTVEDLGAKDPKAAEAASESARYYKSKMYDVQHETDLTIYTRMSRILTENILKNENVKDTYINESGRLDVDLVMETVKVMYGFLETLNTIQIEKVDEKYLSKVIKEMKEDK